MRENRERLDLVWKCWRTADGQGVSVAIQNRAGFRNAGFIYAGRGVI